MAAKKKMKKKKPKGGNYTCEICGDVLSVYTMDVHHKTPQAAGGSDFDRNLSSICPRCHDAVHTIAVKLKAGKLSQVEDIARSLFPKSLSRRKALFEFSTQVYRAMRDRVLTDDDEVMLVLVLRRDEYNQVRTLARNYRTSEDKAMSIQEAALSMIRSHIKTMFPDRDKNLKKFGTRVLASDSKARKIIRQEKPTRKMSTKPLKNSVTDRWAAPVDDPDA